MAELFKKSNGDDIMFKSSTFPGVSPHLDQIFKSSLPTMLLPAVCHELKRIARIEV